MPALLTSTSTVPNRVCADRDHARDVLRLRHVGGGVVRLTPKLVAEVSAERAIDLARVAEAVEHHIHAAAAKARAMPSPMPLVEPVTIADLPNRSATRIGLAAAHFARDCVQHFVSIDPPTKKETRGVLGEGLRGPRVEV